MNTIIITGASGNLGTAVTNTMLAAGYRVVATVHNEEASKQLMPHPDLLVEVVDLTDESQANSFIAGVINEQDNVFGALLLVGGFVAGDISSTSLADVKKQLTLNFDTAFNVAKPVFEQMMKKGEGRIVFVGSRPALVAGAGKNMVAYGLSKSLLFKLAEYLNAAAKGTNVTATVIVPSTLDTPVNRKSMPDADPSAWVKPEEIAGILELLMSEKTGTLRETVLKVYKNA